MLNQKKKILETSMETVIICGFLGIEVSRTGGPFLGVLARGPVYETPTWSGINDVRDLPGSLAD